MTNNRTVDMSPSEKIARQDITRLEENAREIRKMKNNKTIDKYLEKLENGEFDEWNEILKTSVFSEKKSRRFWLQALQQREEEIIEKIEKEIEITPDFECNEESYRLGLEKALQTLKDK
jgi:phosphoserine phosphatase